MVHEFYLIGSEDELDPIEKCLSEKGALSFLSNHHIDDSFIGLQGLEMVSASFKDAKGIFSYQRKNDSTIIIKAFFFANNKVIYPGFCASVSEDYPGITVKYRFFEKKNDLCGGLEYRDGLNINVFIFDNVEDISAAITDYFCEMHLSLDKKVPLKLNGKVISEHLYDERAPGKDPLYVIEVYEIQLTANESLCFHMEFNEADPDYPINIKKIDGTYKVYGLTTFSWTLTGSQGEMEGLLHEHLKGDISEIFNNFVSFDCALNIYRSTK